MAGRIIFSSSVPILPLSPEWGFKPQTAIFGLDIFQSYEMNDTFGLSNRMQEYRGCKAFEISFFKL